MRISPIYNASILNKPVSRNSQANSAPIQCEREITYSLWRNSNVSFGSKRTYSSDIHQASEKPGKFKIGTIPDLTCPACGQKILTRSQYKGFLNRIRKAEEKDYFSIVSEYEKYMCPIEHTVFEAMKEEAKQSGETTDIKSLVIKLRDKMLPELEAIQLEKLEKMKSVVETLPEKEKIPIQKSLQAIEITIRDENIKTPFRRKNLIECVNGFNIKNQRKKQRLVRLAESFPSSTENACAWVVKNSGLDKNGNERSSLEIAEKLVSIASTSTDHILARNIELNHDDITNYMAMHNRCNSEKSDKPFLQWFYEDPKNRAKYIQSYLEEVDSALKSGRIKDKKYKNYISECVDTMYRLSDGKVNYKRQFSD